MVLAIDKHCAACSFNCLSESKSNSKCRLPGQRQRARSPRAPAPPSYDRHGLINVALREPSTTSSSSSNEQESILHHDVRAPPAAAAVPGAVAGRPRAVRAPGRAALAAADARPRAVQGGAPGVELRAQPAQVQLRHHRRDQAAESPRFRRLLEAWITAAGLGTGVAVQGQGLQGASAEVAF